MKNNDDYAPAMPSPPSGPSVLVRDTTTTYTTGSLLHLHLHCTTMNRKSMKDENHVTIDWWTPINDVDFTPRLAKLI